MTLTVEVTADGSFTKLVQSALQKVCPCFSLVVDSSTGVVKIGPMSCLCYCDHRVGCNMLADLLNSSRNISIVESSGNSGYKNDEVWWNTENVDFGDKDVCGNTLIEAWLQLAHELVHAQLNSTLENEDEAVRGENQIRQEHCLPMREDYKQETVPDFRVGVLDSSNRPEYNCTCRFWRGGWWKTGSRFLCVMHSRYCTPKLILDVWKALRPGGTP